MYNEFRERKIIVPVELDGRLFKIVWFCGRNNVNSKFPINKLNINSRLISFWTFSSTHRHMRCFQRSDNQINIICHFLANSYCSFVFFCFFVKSLFKRNVWTSSTLLHWNIQCFFFVSSWNAKLIYMKICKQINRCLLQFDMLIERQMFFLEKYSHHGRLQFGIIYAMNHCI